MYGPDAVARGVGAWQSAAMTAFVVCVFVVWVAFTLALMPPRQRRKR